MALMTISPSLSEQFSAVVNLSVVTNVVPYIVSLSALFVMMRTAGVDQGTYRRNAIVAMVALLYSTYAIYASGMEAVLGGMIVMALGFIVWGFLAPRFTTAPAVAARHTSARPTAQAVSVVFALLAGSILFLAASSPARAGTVDRIRETSKVNLGYRAGLKPFSYRDDAGNPAGYSVALCCGIAPRGSSSRQCLSPGVMLPTIHHRYRDHALRTSAVLQHLAKRVLDVLSESLEARSGEVRFQICRLNSLLVARHLEAAAAGNRLTLTTLEEASWL